MTRTLFAALALTLIAAPAMAAQFEGVIEMKIVTGMAGAGGTGKTYVSKTGWRAEMAMTTPELTRMNGGKAFRTTMFAKAAAPDTIYQLNEDAKTYSIIDAKEMRERAAKMEQEEKKYTIKRLGKDSVAGFSCEKIEATEEGSNQQIEACLAADILGGDFARHFQRDQRSGNWMKAAKKAGVDGFPLRMISMQKDTPDSKQTMEVTKIERKAVPASMFEVPAGFTETSPLGTLGGNADQAKQLEQMQKAMQNMPPEQRKMLEQMMKKQQGK